MPLYQWGCRLWDEWYMLSLIQWHCKNRVDCLISLVACLFNFAISLLLTITCVFFSSTCDTLSLALLATFLFTPQIPWLMQTLSIYSSLDRCWKGIFMWWTDCFEMLPCAVKRICASGYTQIMDIHPGHHSQREKSKHMKLTETLNVYDDNTEALS